MNLCTMSTAILDATRVGVQYEARRMKPSLRNSLLRRPLVLNAAICIVLLCTSLTGWTQTAQGERMDTTDDKAQVLDLIKRVVRAAEAGVLGDEERAKKALNLTVVDHIFGAGTDFARPGRRFRTGVRVLDQESQAGRVGYRAGKTPSSSWSFGISGLGDLVCIEKEEVDALFGPPHTSHPAPHGQKNFGGSYDYREQTATGLQVAGFDYIRRHAGQKCLDTFSVQHGHSR